MRGTGIPDEAVIDQRERQIMRATRAMFGAGSPDESNPWLLKLIAEYMKVFPEEKAAIVDALNDTSHGVFVDRGALALWKDHYLAAVEIDKAKLNLQGIAAARQRWREQVLADPGVLLSRLGPELPCELPSRKVRVAAFGEEMTVRFDLNTVQPGRPSAVAPHSPRPTISAPTRFSPRPEGPHCISGMGRVIPERLASRAKESHSVGDMNDNKSARPENYIRR